MKVDRSWRYLFGFVIALSFSTAATARVDVDFDESVNFSKYKTYAWQAGTPSKDPLMEKRIQNAVEGELNIKGLAKKENGADLYVITHATSKTETQVDTNSLGYAGHRWHGWDRWGSTTVNVYEIPTGTLMVDLLDARSNELVWRGIATKTLSENPQKIAKLINKVVKKMFKKYPPKQRARTSQSQSNGGGY